MGTYSATGSKPVLRALLKDLQDHRRSSGILPCPLRASTAEQGVEQEADYVLAVKENQPKLHAHLQQLFDRAESKLRADPAVDYWATEEENHGRCETRHYWTTDQIEPFADQARWPGLRLFGMVEAIRHNGGRSALMR